MSLRTGTSSGRRRRVVHNDFVTTSATPSPRAVGAIEPQSRLRIHPWHGPQATVAFFRPDSSATLQWRHGDSLDESPAEVHSF